MAFVVSFESISINSRLLLDYQLICYSKHRTFIVIVFFEIRFNYWVFVIKLDLQITLIPSNYNDYSDKVI